MTPTVIAAFAGNSTRHQGDLVDYAPKLAAWMQPIVQQIVT